MKVNDRWVTPWPGPLSYCVDLAHYLSLRLMSGVSEACLSRYLFLVPVWLHWVLVLSRPFTITCLFDWLLEMGLPEPRLLSWQWWLQKQTNAWIQLETLIAVSRVSTLPFSTQSSSFYVSPDRSPQTLDFPIHFKVVEVRLGDLRAHLSLCRLSGVEHCMVNRIQRPVPILVSLGLRT